MNSKKRLKQPNIKNEKGDARIGVTTKKSRASKVKLKPVNRPDFSLETLALGQHGGLVAGVDEAGRGPLAGPVVSAVVALSENCLPEGIDDSKRMTEARREKLFDKLMELSADGLLHIGVGIADIERIDRDNILQASLWTMSEAVKELNDQPKFLLVDGNKLPKVPMAAEAIVKGDGRCLSIAAASIIAKVTRDRLMFQLDAEFPHYGWRSNKGYGTAAHLQALVRHGITPHHRRSFMPVKVMALRG